MSATAGLCDTCKAKPKHFDGTKTHPYCSKTCAANMKNMCDTCHAKPKYVDGTKTHPYCGRVCASKMKNLCDMCHTKLKFFDGTKTHDYCSKICADNVQDMCDNCGKEPKYNDGQTTHSFCSRTCAQQAGTAGAAGGGTTPAPSNPLKNGCLLCGKAVRKGHFCSQACNSQADKKAPQLLEIHNGHDTFKSVVDQFKASWRHPTTCPTVSGVYKVVGHPTSISNYEAYRASVEARGNFSAAGRSPGNEKRRWHGTTRGCSLGENGNITLCSSTSCSLCGIIRTSYSLNQFGKKTNWGRFGKGIYTSSTSSKSNDYSSNLVTSKHKAMLLNKVVVGKGCKMTQNNTGLTAPPTGYDSVLAEVGGVLNYDELVCYTENAIRPSYLVIYDA